jgi:dienelactone hydrolase
MAWRSLLVAARLLWPITALLLWPMTAGAGETPSAAEMRNAAGLAPDLAFPAQAIGAADLGTPRMAVLKPDGDGPFPALVLFHQCGGLGQRNRTNLSMADWAGKAVGRGYVVLLIDAMASRDVDTVCFGPKNGLTFARGVRDAFQAAAFLRRQPYVDPGRVGLAGWSWGAMVGLLAARSSWAGGLAEDGPFRAVVSMYPGCFTLRPRNGSPAYDVLDADVATPLMVLMGGQDTETPAADCEPRLEAAKAAGAPVEWHLYPDATHCWDCRQLDGFSKVDVRGNRVTYRFDREVTADSTERMFGFLDRTMR